jgi:hypothetical protein
VYNDGKENGLYAAQAADDRTNRRTLAQKLVVAVLSSCLVSGASGNWRLGLWFHAEARL